MTDGQATAADSGLLARAIDEALAQPTRCSSMWGTPQPEGFRLGTELADLPTDAGAVTG